MTRTIIAFLLLVLAGVIFYAGVLPQWRAVSDGRAEIARLQSIHNELIELEAKRAKLTEEYNAISENDLKKISAIAPASKETSSVLGDFESLAKKNGLTLDAIDFTTPRDALASGAYQPIQVNMNARGAYDSLVGFLRSLERNLRLMDVTEISFSGISSSGGARVISAGIKGNIYYQPR